MRPATQSATGIVAASEATSMSHYNVYRDHAALGHYVVLRNTGLYTVRYYPRCEEIHINGIVYHTTDGIYQWGRLAGYTRKAKQEVAERLSLDILTWHTKVANIGLCHCGKRAKLVIDPWYEDIHNRTVYDYLCKDCYQQAIEDI